MQIAVVAIVLPIIAGLGVPPAHAGGVGVATDTRPLVLDVPTGVPAPGRSVYLRLGASVPESAGEYSPTIRLVLELPLSIGSTPEQERLLGALSVFPWPPGEQTVLEASFNLSRVTNALAKRLNVAPAKLYARVRIAIQVVPDSRDPRPVSLRVDRLETSVVPDPSADR